MTISIHGSAAALATLDNLSQSGASAGAASPPPTETDAKGVAPSTIIDLSSLAAGASGASAAQATSLSIADAAVASGGLIEGLLSQLRQDAVSASDPGLDPDTRAALSSGFQGGLAQINSAVAAAGVDGVNLLDGSAGQAPDGLPAFDFSLGGPLIGVTADASLTDPATSAGLAGQLGAALDSVGHAVGQIAARGDALLTEALQGGSASAGGGVPGVDPTLDADGARLAALQIQQQLSAGADSVSNQAPQAILALFR